MPNTQSGKPGRRAVIVGVAGLISITIGLLAGCSSSSPVSSSAAPGAAVARPAAGSVRSATTVRLAPTGAQLIYTAQFTVRAREVMTAVSRATSIVLGAGGYVSQENASDSPSAATLQVKIPVAAYPATLSQLTSGPLGARVSLQQQAQDVTQQVADVTSQVTSDEAAIAQLRTLLSRTGSVADLLSVQDQINTEESDLEAMQAQQTALDDETAFATVTITILGPVAVVKPASHRSAGLVSGLVAGWRAFRVAITWLLAILGAVAPFAAIAALGGFLAYRLRRRTRS
jgi:hypothetical protein